MERSSYSINTQEAIEYQLTKKSKEEVIEFFTAMMSAAKINLEDDFKDLIQDQEFGAFLQSTLGINIHTEQFNDNFIFTGICKCGMRISKSINDPHSTRSDNARYFYTAQDENDGYNIFRCKQCKKVIDERWSRDTNMPIRVKG